jgi:hypothetical protein
MELLHRNVEESAGTSWRELLRPGMRGALIADVGLAVFQQFVGPNTMLFYTPTIFGYAGVTGNSLLPTIYVGAVLFVFVSPPSRSSTSWAARIRRHRGPQEAVLSRSGGYGIDARAAGPGVPVRREELEPLGASDPATTRPR